MERIQEATIAFEVPDTQEDMLEGLCFDRQGNLYFVGAVSGLLFKADVDTGEVKTLFLQPLKGMVQLLSRSIRMDVCL